MLKYWSKLRLLTKLSIMILSVIIVTMGSFYLINRQLNKEAVLKTESTHLLDIAQAVSTQSIVKNSLLDDQSNPVLQEYTLSIREQFNLDYVVIITKDSIRLTHPDKAMIYENFAGGDELPALAGEEYTSTGEGTFGRSLRSFVPVFDKQNIIGAVVAGKTNQSLDQINQQFNRQITLGFVASIIIGFLLATLVAYSIKLQLFNMEPNEIAQRFEERNAMFEYSHDSVIVTNQNKQITLANNEAIQHFNIDLAHSTSYLDKIFPDIAVDEQNNSVLQFNNKDYIFSQAPIIVKEELIGYIYIIRDATEIYTLLNQLYSTSQYAHLLQAQAHDFLNKLHVIYGLTDLKDYTELESYLDSLITQEDTLTVRISMMVHNPIIAGQLIGLGRQLKTLYPNTTINILSEIPNTNNAQTNHLWMDTIKTIQDTLIQRHTQTDISLDLELNVRGGQLITRLLIKGNIPSLHQYLENNLQTVNMNMHHEDNYLSLTFTMDYEENIDEV